MIVNRQGRRRLLERGGAIRRHWLWILAGGAACATGALIVSLFLPKMYLATTYLLVSDSKIGDASRDTNLQQMAMLQTFIPFVDNDALIEQSLKTLGLDQPPYQLTVDAFRRKNHLDVRAPKSTRLLELNIEFPDARLSADLANAIALGAVEFNDRLNASDTLSTQEFLKQQLDQARVVQSEAARERLLALNEARLENLEKDLEILLAEKESLSTHLQQLRLDYVQNQSRSKSLERVLSGEPEVIVLKRSITADRFAEIASRQAFPDGTPLVVTEEAINETRESIRQTLVNASVNGSSQNAGIEAAVKRLEEVNREIPRLMTLVTEQRGRIEAANQDYQLAVDATKNASHQYQTASVTVSSKSQDIKQIAPALVPERPIRPKIWINTLLGFLLGNLVLAMCAIVLEGYREMRAEDRFMAEDLDVAPVAGVHRR